MNVTYIVPLHELVPRPELLGHGHAFELKRVNSRLRSRHDARGPHASDAVASGRSETHTETFTDETFTDKTLQTRSLLATLASARDW